MPRSRKFALQLVEGSVRSRHHAQFRAIDRGHRQHVAQQPAGLLLGQTQGQHPAGGQFLHHAAASSDHGQGVLEREHAGQASRDQFPHAMADHRLRLHAQAHPEAGKRVLDDE